MGLGGTNTAAQVTWPLRERLSASLEGHGPCLCPGATWDTRTSMADLPVPTPLVAPASQPLPGPPVSQGPPTLPGRHTFPTCLLPVWEEPVLPPRKLYSWFSDTQSIFQAFLGVQRAWAFKETLCSYFFGLFLIFVLVHSSSLVQGYRAA